MTAKTILAPVLGCLILAALFAVCAQEKEEITIKEVEIELKPHRQTRDPVRKEERIERRIILEGPRDITRDEQHERKMHRLEMRDMSIHNPEKFKLLSNMEELENASREAAERYRKTGEEEKKTEIETTLVGILDQLFDYKIKLKQLEQKRLEEEARKLKKLVEKRKKNKQQIIKLRLRELLGRNEHLRW